jgi:hypothetical protein
MPKHFWFKHVKLSGAKRLNDKIERRHKFLPPLTNNKPKPVSYYRIRLHAFMRVKIGKHYSWLYRLSDIARIYDLHPNTVYGWYSKGLLPEPYTQEIRKHRTWGWEPMPLYLREQVLVICKVLNDIFGQQIGQYRTIYHAHIQMIHAGNQMVLRRIPYKAVPPEKKNKLRRLILRRNSLYS